ncbi:MAG: hypothetical protein M0T85_12385 [Dehalococcoidales bacterium]|nr:hypothetical protein [Dehalococcoidales bacterium]
MNKLLLCILPVVTVLLSLTACGGQLRPPRNRGNPQHPQKCPLKRLLQQPQRGRLKPQP